MKTSLSPPPQLPRETRHLQFHFALGLCLLHLPEESVGKLARVSKGGGTGPLRRDWRSKISLSGEGKEGKGGEAAASVVGRGLEGQQLLLLHFL